MKSFHYDVMTTREEMSSTVTLACLLGLVVLYVAMCLYGSWKGFTGNFDTGTVELMAVNIANGEDFPLFWYGQHYAGALEAYVAAAMIKLLGFSELVLTLSPVFFSVVWIIGTYLLFAEIIDRRTGLVAAVAAVFSGYYSWYYSYALSGGYAVILGLGTLIMWLGIRIYNGNPSFPRLCGKILLIGLLSALAIWVHFFILPYLLVTAVFLLLYSIKHRFAPRILCCFVAGALIASGGLVPFWLVTRGNVEGSSITSFIFTRQHLVHSLHTLFARDFSQYVFWKDNHLLLVDPALIYGLCLAVLLVVGGCSLVYVVRQKAGRRVLLLSAPFLYLFVFFAIFIPHKMSVIPSPRYLLGPWTMIVSVIWAYSFSLLSGRKGRVLWTALLFFWIGYNGLGDYLFTGLMAPVKSQRLQEAREILDLVRAEGVKAVQMLGNEHYGFEGQKLSALSGNGVRFVYTGKERYQKNAQFVENEPDYALMCRFRDRGQVSAAFEPLDIDFKEQPAGDAALFYDFQIDNFRRQSLAPQELSLHLVGNKRGTADDLQDRNASTVVVWENDNSASLSADFGREVMLSSFWLFGPQVKREGEVQGLPLRYEVSAAQADTEFRPVFSFKSKVNQSYIQSGHVYVSGYFGKAECRFQPFRTRYLKISFAGNRKITLNEIVFFKDSGVKTDSVEEDLGTIFKLLGENHAEFTLTDRWLSAAIIDAVDSRGSLPALPRFNPRADNQAYSRLVIPRKGLVLAPAREIADDCQQQILSLYGQEAISQRVDLHHYSLFLMDRARKRKTEDGFLYWNGHLLLRLTDYADLALINLTRSGMLFLDPAKEKTTGFYHDSWTNGEGVLQHLHLPLSDPTLQTLILVTNGNAPFADDPEALHLRVMVNGEQLKLSHREDGSYLFQLPKGLDMVDEIRILSSTFIPASADNRVLGLDVVRILIL